MRTSLPHAPRRAVRNVLLLWLGILLVAGVPVVYRWQSAEPDAAAVVALERWHDAVEAARGVLPSVDEYAQDERALVGAALRLALPAGMMEDVLADAQRLPSWRTMVREAVRVLIGVDVVDPVSVLAFELPGFDDFIGVGAGEALPPSARTMALPTLSRTQSSAPLQPSPPLPPSPLQPSPLPPSSSDSASEAGTPTRDVPSGPAVVVPPTHPPSTTPPRPEPTPATPHDRLRAVAWGDDCRVLIYHTHTSEMYRTATFAPANPQQYHLFDTTDTGIVHVGRAMAHELEQLGIPACHLTNIHDWPSHPRAYIESRATVEQFLQRHPHVEIVLDVHRDAPPGLVTTVGGRRAAQVAFVVGTNTGMHPSWPENAAFARALADLLGERYPGLFRRIIDRPDARLNQDLHPRAILVEIGSYDTYLDEAVASAEMFAEVVADMLHVIRFGYSVMDARP